MIQSIFIFGDEPIQFPRTVTSVSGEEIDIDKLSANKTVVVVTLKSPTCPVCKNQLERIERNLGAFEMCNMSFLVVCPGSADTDLEIGNQMGLILKGNELYPSIFVLKSERTIRWMQKGRNYLCYGDEELKEALNCHNWI